MDRLAAKGCLWPLLATLRRGDRTRSDGAPGRRATTARSWLHIGDRLVTTGSDVCIDGFPRSANSYTVFAFTTWNPEARVAHHMHAAFQARRAVKLGVPCCVLVRPPLETVASVIAMTAGRVSDTACYRSYIRFHELVAPMRWSIVVCRFHEVVADPSVVVSRLNQRFGTNFASEPMTPEVREWFGSELRRIVRDRFGLPEESAPMPDTERGRRAAALSERLSSHPLLARATAAHAAVAGDGAVGGRSP